MEMDSIRKIDKYRGCRFFPLRMTDFVQKSVKPPDPPPDDPALKGWTLGNLKMYKQYKVCLQVSKRSFECLLSLSVKFNVPPPTEIKLVELSRIAFLDGIRRYISSCGAICLPKGVVDIDKVRFHGTFQADPNDSPDGFMDPAYFKNAGKRVAKTMLEQMDDTFQKAFTADEMNYDRVQVDTPAEPTYKCEADKPIGTRDVDKFLREQQAKLWNGGS